MIDEASEIVGVSPSAITSSIASVAGVVLVPMIASTWFSPSSFLVTWTAVVVSVASSSTMYSTLLPPIVFGHIAIVFFSGMPSDAAGPVAETTTPTLTCASATPANASIATPARVLFMLPPRIRIGIVSGRGFYPTTRAGRMQESAEARAAAARRLAVERVVRKPRKKRGRARPRLQAREVHAGAGVDAEAERDVAVGLAREIEPVGVGNCAGSRFAAPMHIVIRESGGSATPPTTISRVVIRLPSWLELSKRRNSSTAERTKSSSLRRAVSALLLAATRSARAARCRSGWWSSRGRH